MTLPWARRGGRFTQVHRLLLSLVLFAGCRCRPASPSHPDSPPPPIKQDALIVHVPRITGDIKIDGELKEPQWRGGEWVSPLFQDALGKEAPFTQLKMMADDRNLYLEVYVADQDLRTEDEVAVEVGPLHLMLHPKKPIVPAGVQIGEDTDGTIDNPNDYDEEWISEIAIPWDLLKSRRVPFHAVRVDVGKYGPPHSLAWPPHGMATLVFE